MFNLGYMHELGHGMPKDIHLAKRFYDMAAETSADAKVPVALALAKLGLGFAISNWPYSFQSFKVTISPDIYAKLELYWDIYLLTLLVGLLGVVLLVRRPRGDRQQRDNNVERHPVQTPPGTSNAPATEVASNGGASPTTENSSENSNNDIRSGSENASATNETHEARPP